MTDPDIVARAANLMGSSHWESTAPSARRLGRKPTFTTEATGWRAVEIMSRIRAQMGVRRGERVADLIDRFAP